MNFFLILIPQSLNSQCLNLPPHSHYEEDGVQKADLFFRSNNDVCNMTGDEAMGCDCLINKHRIDVNVQHRKTVAEKKLLKCSIRRKP